MRCSSPPDRRGFLRLAILAAGGTLLPGCSGGDAGAADPITVVSAQTAGTGAAPTTATTGSPLNLALTLAYVGAQFHGQAALGTALPAEAMTGIGSQGAATGARQIAFADPVVARLAAELAADKHAHVLALRAQLGTSAAAQPAIDLSSGSTGPFALAATGGRDVYADDAAYLLGAFLVENRVAAAYRTLLATVADESAQALVAGQLADAIFHGGVIRSLLADRAASDPTLDAAVTAITVRLAALDGSDVGDHTLAGATGASTDLLDAEGRAIAFTRDTAQVLRALVLSPAATGGFLPAGANGLG